jgi:hypothetical protein
MAGLNVRVDHRSFERRGIEDVPTIHLGSKASAMERWQSGSSDRGDINREIERHNAHRRLMRTLRAEGRRLMQRQASRGEKFWPPVTPRSRAFLPRPQIAVEARQRPKRPAREKNGASGGVIVRVAFNEVAREPPRKPARQIF